MSRSSDAQSHETERLARAALGLLVEPGDLRVSGLVADLGPVRLRELLGAERDVTGCGTDVAARLGHVQPEEAIEAAARAGIRFVIPGDSEWPTAVGDLQGISVVEQRGGPPLGLWVRGPLRLDELAGAVSVVGARAATTYGCDVAREMGATVAESGRVVVSGAALGIDQAAHRGALAAGGRTVAVLACGADRVYPSTHRRLIEHIAATGAVVSEAPPGWAPLKIRFLARNRLIAAVGVGTVVVEAAIRSGALNTAHWAERLGRQVMGVPGPTTSAQSEGVHELIRNGGAVLVTRGDHVLELVGAAGEHLLALPRATHTARDQLTLRQRLVLDAVPVVRSATVESIARTAGIAGADATDILAELLSAGFVQQHGERWRMPDEQSPFRAV